MKTIIVLFAIVGFIAAAVFATKKVSTIVKNALEKKEEAEDLAVLTENCERFKNWNFVAGDVCGHIVNYEWVSLRLETQRTVYKNYHEFIEIEYRQKGRITAFEFEHLNITEIALRDCRAGKVLPVRTQDLSIPVSGATIIETDDYGKLVKYSPERLINVGGTNRMAAYVAACGEDLFIKEIHVSRRGFTEASSVTIYPIATETGERDMKWVHAFQKNVESSELWEKEMLALQELKGTLSKWNDHRDLVSFDHGRGIWIVTPQLEEVVEETVEEAAASTVEETPEALPEKKEDAVNMAIDALGELSPEELALIVDSLASQAGYTKA